MSATNRPEEEDAILPATEETELIKSVRKERYEVADSVLPAAKETGYNEPIRKNNIRGYLLMLGSTFFFAAMSCLVHVAEHTFSFPTATSVFVRGSMNTAFAILGIMIFSQPRSSLSKLTSQQKMLLCLRGFIGALSIVSLFTALRHLPVGEAITIFFTSPIITLLLSHATIREPLTIPDLSAAIVSVIGVAFIVYQPNQQFAPDAIRPLGLALAIGAAFFSSTAYVIVRSLGTSIHFMTSILALAVSSLFVSILLGGARSPAALLDTDMKQGSMLVILASISAFMGQCCLNQGLQHCRAGPGVLVRSFDVPLTYVFGLIFLEEQPSWRSFVGTCLVLSSTIVIGLRQISRS